MPNVYETLLERGFIAQCTHEEQIKKLLSEEKITFYTGYDPTADSLHIGHFLQIIVMKHMQDAGHRPIALLGGGTTMVGDPTGKTDMRKMLSKEEIAYNASRFKKVFEKFIDFSDGKAIMVNNADWLLNLNYIDFLRDVGVYFSVNRMLTAESVKSRLERGLSFLEFNYMLMQSYDFLELFNRYSCVLQLGGDDQWSNIINGVDLIRRATGKESYGLTFTLLTTSEGKKMGKTEKGALWLDPEKTSPYEFYQYWRNIDDPDVYRCLSLLTFLPMDEVRRLSSLPGEQINEAKKVLAYEVTKLVHGEEEAKKAQESAQALFEGGQNLENMPTTEIAEFELKAGIGILDILVLTGMAPSKAEARRLIQQGGISVNDTKVTDMNLTLNNKDLSDGEGIIIKKGKKTYHRVKAI